MEEFNWDLELYRMEQSWFEHGIKVDDDEEEEDEEEEEE